MNVKIVNWYCKSCKLIFFIFLFGILSFGRAFSIINIKIGSFFSVFITEIIIFLCLPFIIMCFKDIQKLPKIFLVFLVAYLFYGCFYLGSGLLNNNLFALRDIVLCVYIVFLPLTLLIFSRFKEMKLVIYILVLGNIIGLFLGRSSLFNVHNLYKFQGSHLLVNILSQSRFFNLGLFYGMTSSFLISFFPLLKRRSHIVFVFLALSFNFYMLIFMGVRSLWSAAFLLIVFLLLNLRMRFFRWFMYFIPVFLIIASILFYFDFQYTNITPHDILAKARSLSYFLKETISSRKITASFPAKEKSNSPITSPITSRGNVYGSISDKASLLDNSTALSKKANVPPQDRSDPLYSYQISLDNINWRLIIWKESIQFGMKSFWFGGGFGVYPKYNIWNYSTPVGIGLNSGIIPAHNHLITVFYKMGFCGLFLFLCMNLFVFIYGISNLGKCKTEFARSFLAAALGAFLYWHTLAFFFDIIDSPSSSIFLWIIMGLIFKIIDLDRKNYA